MEVSVSRAEALANTLPQRGNPCTVIKTTAFCLDGVHGLAFNSKEGQHESDSYASTNSCRRVHCGVPVWEAAGTQTWRGKKGISRPRPGSEETP
ncbi:hypothetical protein SBV1_280012 [Verrucomicrobia bacterium]|nr:hypothetical protein SBV1_280012 [Verrucomicrobiota bacterium]